MSEEPRKPLQRRVVDRVARPWLGELQGWIGGLQDTVFRLHGDLGRVHRDLEDVKGRVERIEADAHRAAAGARYATDEEAENRRRLRRLRESEEYELAFAEEEPLVSFLVPTYDSYETLRDVALPSILSQTHANLEVIVVGDCAPPETQRAIEEVDDPRVVYYNRTVRGPYPEERQRRWFVIGSPPLNEALARARGRWIAVIGDDDAARPTHTEHLLAAAREQRHEHCYGLQLVDFAEGEPMTLGEFPPRLGQWGLQAALFHAGLRFIEPELLDADFEEANDWSMCRRMLRAGVRFGMLDEIVVDKHETRRRSAGEWDGGAVPTVE